jgi:hypothetical protein
MSEPIASPNPRFFKSDWAEVSDLAAVCRAWLRDASMTSADDVRKADELDGQVNNPDVPVQPQLIWCMVDEVMKRERRIDASIWPCRPISRYPPTARG